MAVKVMDRAGVQARLRVDVAWQPVFELIMELAAQGSLDIYGTFDVVPPPFDELRTKLSPELAGCLEILGPGGGRNWGPLLALAWSRGLATPGDLIGYLEAMLAVELRMLMCGSHWPAVRALMP